jgi:hypothetical protein
MRPKKKKQIHYSKKWSAMKSLSYLYSKLQHETILIAVIPFLGWMAAFAFETGYLMFFDISWSFIDIGLPHILAATIALIFAVVTFGPIVSRIVGLSMAIPRGVWFAILILFFVFMLVVVGYELYRKDQLKTAFFLIAAIIAGTVILGLYIKKSGPENKAAQLLLRASISATTAMNKSDRFGASLVGPFLAVWIVLVVVGIAGYNLASHTEAALVLEEKPDYIFVRKYGETYLFKQIDVSTLSISGGIHLVKMGDGKELQMRKVWMPELEGSLQQKYKERYLYYFGRPDKNSADKPLPRLPI